MNKPDRGLDPKANDVQSHLPNLVCALRGMGVDESGSVDAPRHVHTFMRPEVSMRLCSGHLHAPRSLDEPTHFVGFCCWWISVKSLEILNRCH